MKYLTGIILLFTILFLISGLQVGCSSSPVAGSGSQAGNGKIIATVHDSDNRPVGNAAVFMRKKNFLKDTIHETISTRFPDTYTNSEGKFTLDSVSSGEYFIEVHDGVNKATFIECVKDTGDAGPKDLGIITLWKTASFFGTVKADRIPDTVNVFVQLYGLDYARQTDSAGRFSFNNVPAGEMQLRIFSGDASLGMLDSVLITTHAGDTYDAGFFHLPFEFFLDTLIVREILDSNGLTNVSYAEVSTMVDGQIRRLDLNGRAISKIPPVIGNLRLTHLYLEYNEIRFLPSEIGKLSSLVHLDVSRNNMTSLPSTLWNLNQLETLDIGGNLLDYLPDEIGNLTALKSLTLKWTRLRSVPRPIGNLTLLQSLSIERNELTTLPIEITTLANLDYLNVNFNRLSPSIPHEIEAWIDTYSTDPRWRETQHHKP